MQANLLTVLDVKAMKKVRILIPMEMKTMVVYRYLLDQKLR